MDEMFKMMDDLSRKMKIENLKGVIEKLNSAKAIVLTVREADEKDYYSVPETLRDENLYHNINTLEVMEEYLGDMIDDLNKMVEECNK